jgi:hypothetical protein
MVARTGIKPVEAMAPLLRAQFEGDVPGATYEVIEIGGLERRPLPTLRGRSGPPTAAIDDR